MNPIHYKYSLTNFVVFDDYETERFTDVNSDDHSQVILNTLNYSMKKKISTLDGQLKQVFVSKKSIQQYLIEGKGTRVYNPLFDTPELYLELNKVELFNEKLLMKFIKEYGIPYHEHSSSFGIYQSNLFKQNSNEAALRIMDTMFFYEKLIQFKKAVTLWNDIKQNNEVSLKRVKEDFSFYANFNEKQKKQFIEELSLEQYLNYICADLGIVEAKEREMVTEIFKNSPDQIWKLQQKASIETATWNKVKDLSDKDIAMAYLNLELGKLKSGKSSNTYINGKIVPAVAFKNLLEVAAFQLKQAIFNDTKLEFCLNCGALFEPRHAHQRYCSPLPNRQRSTCENTYNQRLKRKIRKEKELQN